MGRQQRPHVVPRPDRVRSLAGTPFGWIAVGVSRQGWLRALTPEAVAAYTFLCLVADRQGVSWYGRDRIGRELGLGDRQVYLALSRLEELDLVAYQPFRAGAPDGYRQVLSLPHGGPSSPHLSTAIQRVADRLAAPSALRARPPGGAA